MFSSSSSSIAATGATFSYVSPCPACTARPTDRANAAASDSRASWADALCPLRIRVLPRVQFHRCRPEICRYTDRVLIRVDKERCTDARLLKPTRGARGRSLLNLGIKRQSTFRRDLLTFLRHQRSLSGAPGTRQRDHLLGSGEFKIDRGSSRIHEKIDVPVLDVTSILSEVDRESVGPPEFREHRCSNRIRLVRHAGLPDRRDVVDVHVQAHIKTPLLWSPDGDIG